LRAVANQDQLHRGGRQRERADGQVRTLDAFETADEQQVIAERARAQLLGQHRWMVERLRRDAVETAQPVGRVLRVGKDVAAFAEHLGIELDQPLAQPDIGFVVLEVAVRRSAELVGDAVLVDHPGDLAWMAREVGRKPRRDHQVDWTGLAG
jgi:hypothetical protein